MALYSTFSMVDSRNLYLSTRRRFHILCNFNYPVIIEVKTGHGIIALGGLRLFFDGYRAQHNPNLDSTYSILFFAIFVPNSCMVLTKLHS